MTRPRAVNLTPAVSEALLGCRLRPVVVIGGRHELGAVLMSSLVMGSPVVVDGVRGSVMRIERQGLRAGETLPPEPGLRDMHPPVLTVRLPDREPVEIRADDVRAGRLHVVEIEETAELFPVRRSNLFGEGAR